MEVSLAAEKIGSIFGFPITNSLFTSVLISGLLILAAVIVSRSYTRIPNGFQNVVELIIEALYTFSESIAGPKTKYFFPFVATFFLFIITANYFGLLPGVGTVGFFEHAGTSETHHAQQNVRLQDLAVTNFIPGASAQELEHRIESARPSTAVEEKMVLVPLFRSANSDLNVTLAMGLISVLVTHYFAVRFLGWKEYLLKYFSLNPIYLFVGVLEIVAELTKILSLSLRLFGNIFSGEALLATINTLAAFIVPLPFYFLEIIVGFVQAIIFAVLTLVFMTMLSQKHVEEGTH